MRRIAKLSLLVAPLFLASFSGCATPSWMSRSDATDPREARISRLMAVAAEFEKEGKQDAAMRVYEHVLAQQPDTPAAQQRRDYLAQNGVKSGGKPLKADPGLTAKELYAAASRPKSISTPAAQSTDAKDLAEEIHRKNTELARMLAEQKNAKQPLVAIPTDPAAFDSNLQPTPVADPSLIAGSKSHMDQMINSVRGVDDLGWTSAGAGTGWTVVAAPSSQTTEDGLAAAEERTTLTATSSIEVHAAKPAEQALAQTASGWEDATSTTSGTKLVSASTSSKTVVENDEAWHTTDLTRPVSKPTVTENAEDWSTTRLLALCEDLKPELVPMVEKLESNDPVMRVSGLLELGELKTEAKSASVAVYSLMEDKDPIVAVYAAGTLRQITGDAWSSVHTLMKYLDHSEPGIVQLSAYLLGQIGPEAMDAVPALTKLRDFSDNMNSLHAAEALSHIAPDDAASVSKLAAALKSADRELRWFAAVSLGSVTGSCEEQAAEALKLALHDGETDVQVAACLSLGGLGETAAIAIPDLEKAASSDVADLKSAAETALACLKG